MDAPIGKPKREKCGKPTRIRFKPSVAKRILDVYQLNCITKNDKSIALISREWIMDRLEHEEKLIRLRQRGGMK